MVAGVTFYKFKTTCQKYDAEVQKLKQQRIRYITVLFLLVC